jgi:hypothetical protein
MKRYSRMVEFEFIYPDEKMELKYQWLQKLAEIQGNERVTLGIVKDYQDEKAKPFYHGYNEDEEQEG